MSEKQLSRREVLKKAAYVTPVILTVQANFSFASAGSGDYADEKTKSVEYLGRGDENDEHKKHNENKNEKRSKRDNKHHKHNGP